MEAMQAKAKEATNFLKTMAHPERLMVLCQLVGGETGAGELSKKSELSQSAFSQQLRVLRDQKFVKTRKDAQQVFYSIADDRVKKLLGVMLDTFCK